MFGLCSLPSAFSNQPSEWRKNLFSIEDVPCSNALPLQARLGLLFLFLPVLCPSALPHPPMGRRFSSHPGLPVPLDSATTGSHSSNRAGLGLCWYPFPYSSPKIANRAVHGLFPVPDTLFLTFPYGERPACSRKCAVPVFRIRSQRPHTASTGWEPVSLVSVFSTLPPKSHTGPHRAEFEVTSFSWGALGLVALPNLVPACSLLPLE